MRCCDPYRYHLPANHEGGHDCRGCSALEPPGTSQDRGRTRTREEEPKPRYTRALPLPRATSAPTPRIRIQKAQVPAPASPTIMSTNPVAGQQDVSRSVDSNPPQGEQGQVPGNPSQEGHPQRDSLAIDQNESSPVTPTRGDPSSPMTPWLDSIPGKSSRSGKESIGSLHFSKMPSAPQNSTGTSTEGVPGRNTFIQNGFESRLSSTQARR